MSTELHEATHAGMALWSRRHVTGIEIVQGSSLPGETLGECRCPLSDGLEANQVMIAIAGYMATDTPDWPPPWPACCEAERESLGLVISLLKLDQEQYERLVELTSEILASEHFRRLRDAIARALRAVPVLTAEDVAALCEATGTPIPPRQQEYAHAA
jgi:hypothetical protein